MNSGVSTVASSSPSSIDRFLPWALLLFIGSGAAALIYEVIWFQLLQLVIGSSNLSMGVLLATFMGGMGLGSWWFGRVISRRFHPLVVYAVLELLIGACGLAIMFGLPAATNQYFSWASSGGSDIWRRCLLASICLLPPTMAMGATLPAIARWMETTPEGISRMGLFYAFNIMGAVIGSLAAGFYLLRNFSLEFATLVALVINIAVALIAVGMARFCRYAPQVEQVALMSSTEVPRRPWSIYIAIGLSGLTALGAEVVWARLLSLMLGATVYTFSIILAVFLVGLGLGSQFGSWWAGSVRHPRSLFGLMQLLLVAGIAWAAWSVTAWLPMWPVDVSLGSTHWINVQMDICRAAFAMLPAACCWGASFPLAIACASRYSTDPGRLVGGISAANTLGAILGALLFSAWIVPTWGTQGAHQLLIGLAAVSSIILLTSVLVGWERSDRQGAVEPDGLWAALLLIAVLCGAAWLANQVPKVPAGLIGYGRFLPTYKELPNFLMAKEGSSASIAVSEESDGTRNFHVSGKVVASSNPFDMSLQRMLSLLPGLVHSQPKSVLVVGCGAGVTAGTLLTFPSIERIVICEIEANIPRAAGDFFATENYGVIDDPRVTIVYDDARHYVATTNEKFDIITSDPIHPWVKGAATLYSKEYFDLCKQKLNPGGVVTQWVPLYENSPEAANSQIGTFMQSFPHGSIWGNLVEGAGYDLVLMAQLEPTVIDIAQWQTRLDQPDHQPVKFALQTVGFADAFELVRTYSGQASDLGQWIDQKYLNEDHNLRLQYLAGASLNSYREDEIYRELVTHRKYPDQLIRTDGETEFQLRRAWSLNAPRDLQPSDKRSLE